jgi:hypothetical protein
LRSNLRGGGDSDVARAVAYGQRVKLYPLSQATSPPPTRFLDAIDIVYDSTIPDDTRLFESLDRFVQAEPCLARDKAMISMLESIGIEKGKPFRPDARTRGLLEDAAREARAWLDVRYEAAFSTPFYEGSRWAVPVPPDVIDGQATFYARPDSYPLDGRGVLFSIAYFSAKHLGAGQFYLMTIKDQEGRPLDGGITYRLTVPSNPPVKLYWSTTIYDRATHALIHNQTRSSRSSNTPGLQKNSDGSVDVYFGPKAPPGRDANWVPTGGDGHFEILFRFYGPEKALFDKTWRLPDVESTREARE